MHMSFAYSTIIARLYSIPFAVPAVVSANELSALSSAQTGKPARKEGLKSLDKLFTDVKFASFYFESSYM